MRICSALFSIALVLGTATQAAPKPKTGAPKAPAKPRVPPPPKPVATPPAIDNGPGVVIAAPVVAADDAALAEFGAGCGRWLHYNIGGQHQFGKTTTWKSLERARLDLRRPNFQYDVSSAKLLARKVGATHVAIGRLERTGEMLSLAYQWYEIPAGKPSGEGATAKGTREEIVAALPELARTLCQQLVNFTAVLPAAVGLTPDELRTVGRVSWDLTSMRDTLSIEDEAVLRAGVTKSPLMPFLLLSNCLDASESDQFLWARSLAAEPQFNHFAAIMISYQAKNDMGQIQGQIGTNAQQHPQCYSCCVAQSQLHSHNKEYELQRQAGVRALKASPRNPYAWAVVAESYSNKASNLRRGRVVGDITEAEWRLLYEYYPQWLKSLQRAIELDPYCASAMVSLATAATFNSDGALADKYLTRAVELSPYDWRIWDWGLQMYQSKWFGDRAKLMKIAQGILNEPTMSDVEYDDLSRIIYDQFDKDTWNKVMREYYTRGQDAMFRNPEDPATQFHWAFVNANWNQPDSAAGILNTYLNLAKRQEVAYRRAVALLLEKGFAAQALPIVTEGLRAFPASRPLQLAQAQALFNSNQKEPAIAAYEAFVKSYPDDAPAWRSLGALYTRQKKYQDAVATYRKAVALRPYDEGAIFGVGYNLALLLDWPAALAALDTALSLNSRNGNSRLFHATLAYCLGKDDLVVRDAREYIKVYRWNRTTVAMVLLAYFSLQRSDKGTEGRKLLKEAVENADVSQWPYPLVRYLRREITPEQALSLAVTMEQQYEAHCYIGMKMWLQGNRNNETLDHLRFTRDKADRDSVEYLLVLSLLGKPAAVTAP